MTATMRLGQATLVVLVACAAACSPAPPPEPPTDEEVRSFLSEVGEAWSRGEEGALREFFEGGASYPRQEFELLKGAEFWTLRPASRVERLGPDAFRIRLLPERQPERRGPISMRMSLELPVRWGRDGQLRILTRAETERLARLPVPEAPEGEAVVELDFPDESEFGWQAGNHYATELRAEADGEQVCLSIRFEPPLTGPKLRADLPLSERQVFHSGDEIQLEMSLDADASDTTGFRMEDFYRQLDGSGSANTQRIQEWAGFGTEAKLEVDGRKFVQSDGSRNWGLRVKLSKVALQIERPGAWSDRGEVVFDKTHEDPEVAVEGDTLTVEIPASVLPLQGGGAYRVMLEKNGGHSLMLKARQGRTGRPDRR
jgi:hypothetical protein